MVYIHCLCRGERGITSDLNRSTYNMAHTNGMIHRYDPANFCEWVAFLTRYREYFWEITKQILTFADSDFRGPKIDCSGQDSQLTSINFDQSDLTNPGNFKQSILIVSFVN